MRLNGEKKQLFLSELAHTWILDLDGTLVKHNGYKLDGKDVFLPGAKEFLSGIGKNDMVILLTSRGDSMRERTETFLRDHAVRYDTIIYNVPYGERIVVNDDKPSGLRMVIAVEKERDTAINLQVVVDEKAARERMDGLI